jgi:hypothetical protein
MPTILSERSMSKLISLTFPAVAPLLRGVVAAAMLMPSLCAVAQQAHIPLSSYSNTSTGVAFQYPSVWKTVSKPDSMQQPFLFDQGLQPAVVLEFSPKGNLYEKTNLVGLDFVYATAPAASVAECYKLGEADSGAAEKEIITLRGVTYQRASGGDAGMCHQLSASIYATYHDGACHLFEQDFSTLCAGVQEGTRGLTSTEVDALHRHLDAIMQSVTFRGQHD